MTPEQYSWLRLKTKAKDRLVVVGVGQHLEIWNAVEWVDVEKTGRNTATRPAEDIEYDRQLETLMRAAGEAVQTQPPPVSTGEEGEEES